MESQKFNQERIKKCRMLLGDEINYHMDLVGKDNENFKLLVESTERLILLLKRINNPEWAIKQDKLHNSKIWK
jgi:hypothetical protein